MSDYKLPSLGTLTADQVKVGDVVALPHHLSKSTWTVGIIARVDGENLFLENYGDLAFRDRKIELLHRPAPALPTEIGAVIRYTACPCDYSRHKPGSSVVARFDGDVWSDAAGGCMNNDSILASGAKDGFEIARWEKP